MKVIAPVGFDQSTALVSNVPEADYPAWSSATNYVVGNRVIDIGGVNPNTLINHWSYEAIAPSLNVAPITDVNDVTGVGVKWQRIGANNRWKAFDRRINDPVLQLDSISYSVKMSKSCDTIALFGLANGYVSILVQKPSGSISYNVLKNIVDTSYIIDWYTFFTWPADQKSELVFESVPVNPGDYLNIAVSVASGMAQVGEIFIGQAYWLGEGTTQSTVGIEDFSRKEYDEFGNLTLIRRASADRINFGFTVPTDDIRRVKRVLSDLRGTVCVFYSEGNAAKGLTTLATYRDWEIPLGTNVSFANINTEGVI